MKKRYILFILISAIVFFSCGSRISNFLDDFEKVIEKGEALYEQADNGSIGYDECVEKYEDISSRLLELAGEIDDLLQNEITEEETARLIELGLRMDALNNKFERYKLKQW